MYYLQSRYYDPEIGRFINADLNQLNPYAINGLNLYAVPGNNPLSFSSKSANIYNNGLGGSGHGFLGRFSNGSSYQLGGLSPLPSWTEHATKALDLFSSFAGALETTLWAAKNPQFADFFYAAYGISRYDSLNSLSSPLGRFASGIGYLLIAVDVGFDIYNSIQQGYSFGKGVLSAGLTLGKDIGITAASAKIGGLVGGFAAAKLGGMIGGWAGPIGLLVGVTVGFGVGMLIDWLASGLIDEILSWFK